MMGIINGVSAPPDPELQVITFLLDYNALSYFIHFASRPLGSYKITHAVKLSVKSIEKCPIAADTNNTSPKPKDHLISLQINQPQPCKTASNSPLIKDRACQSRRSPHALNPVASTPLTIHFESFSAASCSYRGDAPRARRCGV